MTLLLVDLEVCIIDRERGEKVSVFSDVVVVSVEIVSFDICLAIKTRG